MKHDLDATASGRPAEGESRASRLRRRARTYLGQGVESALAGTLGALGERLGQSLTPREEAAQGKRRLEEVLERDRAQRSARAALEAPAPAAEPPRAAAPKRERDDDLGGAEPIRTRTMARLLAEQGYTKRALAIYDELIARAPDDDALRSAAALLRSPRSA